MIIFSKKGKKDKELKVLIKDYLLLWLSYLKIIILFAILWLFFSGNKDPLMIFCGIIAVIFTFIFCLITKIISPKTYILKLSFFEYIIALAKGIVSSSIQMIRIIFSSKLVINPGTAIVNVSNLTDQEKVLFSNLITMTPGTFVIAIEGDNFLIHALNRDDLNFERNIKLSAFLKKMRSQHEDDEIKINQLS
jgi:multicomponent Na+:H+ antiporter subunit E